MKNTFALKRTENTKIFLHPAVQAALAEKIKDLNKVVPPPPLEKKKGQFHGRRNNGTVDPIIDLADIQIAKDYLLNRAVRYSNNPNNIRDYAIFVVGINCARRIGDMVKFKVSDFFSTDYTWREHFKIKEQKTKKPIKIKINNSVKSAISMLLSTFENYDLDTYVFQSRKGTNQPIDTRSVHRIMKQMSRDTGLDKKYNIGTHTLRKTWARQYYANHPTEILKIQKALNHSCPSITLCYIGITQDEMDEMFDDNEL